MVYQTGEAGPVAGIVALRGLDGVQSIDNGAAKRGFSNAEQFALMSAGGVTVDGGTTGDLMILLGSEAFDLLPFDSATVALALVAGAGPSELYAAAADIRERYGLSTAVDDGSPAGLPATTSLHQNYPNPFNPSTNISFDLPARSHVTLEVYNMLGQRVAILHDGDADAGAHTVVWHASSDEVASGVYFYRLTTEESIETRKMVLLK